FGFLALIHCQRLASILTVEESLQAGCDSVRQSEPSQIGREIDFKGQGHASLRIGFVPSFYRQANAECCLFLPVVTGDSNSAFLNTRSSYRTPSTRGTWVAGPSGRKSVVPGRARTPSFVRTRYAGGDAPAPQVWAWSHMSRRR